MENSYPTLNVRKSEVHGKDPGDENDEDNDKYSGCWSHGYGGKAFVGFVNELSWECWE